MSTSKPDPVLRYASEVVEGKIVAGRLVRMACQRHLDDLEHGAERGLVWDLSAALRAIKFFPDVLRLAEGEFAGQPFELFTSHNFIVGSLFGWKRDNGRRRFRTAYVEMGKGNAKSPLAGGIGLYMLTAVGEASAECYAAATKRDQADILFQDAVKMVEQSPQLQRRILKSGNRKVYNLAHLESGSFFRPISSEQRGLDGKRVHFAALDEVHEHPTSLVVDKMSAGTKGRREALILEITNSGYDRTSVCWKHHEYSIKVLEGHSKDDEWFAFVCTLDSCEKCLGEGQYGPSDNCKDCDDWRNDAVWLKANPYLGISVPLDYLRRQVREAEGMTSKQDIVKRLNFCIWTEHINRWMGMDLWDSCGTECEIDDGEMCFGGLDLALTADLSAFVLLFPPTEARPLWRTKWFFWCPADDIRMRSRRDKVPYAEWAKEKILTATPGNVTDHDFIEQQIREMLSKYDVRGIGYDPSRAIQLVTHLEGEREGLMVKITQNASTVNAPICFIEGLVKGGTLAHGKHPIARWNASNAVTRKDSNGNVKFDKEKATERMDGMSALANAAWLAIAAQDTTSAYDQGAEIFL